MRRPTVRGERHTSTGLRKLEPSSVTQPHLHSTGSTAKVTIACSAAREVDRGHCSHSHSTAEQTPSRAVRRPKGPPWLVTEHKVSSRLLVHLPLTLTLQLQNPSLRRDSHTAGKRQGPKPESSILLLNEGLPPAILRPLTRSSISCRGLSCTQNIYVLKMLHKHDL